jgi:hypothetical protein
MTELILKYQLRKYQQHWLKEIWRSFRCPRGSIYRISKYLDLAPVWQTAIAALP